MNILSLANMAPAIKALADQPLPLRAAFVIGRLLPKAQAELAAYTTAKDAVMQRLGKPAVWVGEKGGALMEVKDSVATVNLNDGGTVHVPVADLRQDQGRFVFANGAFEQWRAETAALDEAEAETVLPKIKLADLGDIKMTPTHMAALADMLEE